MDQRIPNETGPPPGTPERRSRRGTAALAPDRIAFGEPATPPAAAILEYYEQSVADGPMALGRPCAHELTSRIETRLSHRAHCVLVSSATAGLTAALRALCGEPRFRRRLVACPSFTSPATAGAICWAGFEPLFVDIEPDGYALDPESLDAALAVRRGRVAAILACAPFGTAPDGGLRTAWRDVAARHATALLIDSGGGFGALDEYGSSLGTQGDTEVFSFHATSSLPVGQGGAVTTPDPDLAARIGRIVRLGIEPATQTCSEPGFDGGLSELHAAAGLAALDDLDHVLARRRDIAGRLITAAEPCGLRYQRNAAGSTWEWFQGVAPDAEARERILAAAAAAQVDARTLHDPPLHGQPAFENADRGASLVATEAIAARSISLPLSVEMDERQIARVAAVARTP